MKEAAYELIWIKPALMKQPSVSYEYWSGIVRSKELKRVIDMLKKILWATVLLAAASGPALAGQQGNFNWSGFYVGVNGGYGGNNFTYPVSGTFSAPGPVNLTLDASARLTSSGFLGGGQAGYNFASSDGWLFGLEGDFDASDIKGQISAIGSLSGTSTGNAALQIGSKINYLATARARVGYPVANDFVVYVTGGGAFADVRSSVGATVTSGSSTLFSGTASKTSSQTGWVAGLGAEYPISDVLTFRAEYLYADLGTSDVIDAPFSVLGGTGTIALREKTTANIVRVSLNFMIDN